MKKTLLAALALTMASTAADARHIKDTIVKEECGACHMAFQPRFLPAASWKLIMSQLDNHFDEDATLDEKTAQHITDYLTKHAGRDRRFRRALKKGKPPLRITELRWFVREHRHEVSRRARKRAGTMSNCVACHRGAEKGYYDDD